MELQIARRRHSWPKRLGDLRSLTICYYFVALHRARNMFNLYFQLGELHACLRACVGVCTCVFIGMYTNYSPTVGAATMSIRN